MSNWGFEQWVRFAVIWLAIFGLGGGIIAQTSEGASWNGFMAGIWRGVEWYLIIGVSAVVLFFGWVGIMNLASSLNQH